MIDSILTFCDEVLSNPVWFYIITLLIKIVICFAITILFIPVCVYIERRVAAWIQDRVGPNRAGIPLSIFRRFGMKSDLPFKKTLDYFGLPHDGKIANLCRFFRLDRDIPIFGLVQPMVDGGKLFLKQDFTPPFVRRVYFWIAPILVLAPPLMTAAVVPFAGDLQTSYGNVNMAVANLSVGPLWMFAISSLSVYGLVLAGWSSNSKFPFLGGVRSSAQMISYEISMGLSIIPVLMIYSTLDLSNIVEYQAANGWLLLPVWGEGLSWQRWILLVPNENVANWVAVICQLIAYVLKLLFFAFFFVWVRWTLPRFRYDQVMKLGWMVFFELAVINIFLTAAILYFVK